MSERHSPERTPRRMTASTRCRSVAVVKPHQALTAYISLAVTDNDLTPSERFKQFLGVTNLDRTEMSAIR